MFTKAGGDDRIIASDPETHNDLFHRGEGWSTSMTEVVAVVREGKD